MGIVTKTGDKAFTALLGKGRCYKDDPRIEACGAVDELSAFIGFSRSLLRHKKTRIFLESFQKDLFLIGSEVATTGRGRLKQAIRIEHVARLERLIRDLEEKAPVVPRGFVLAGRNQASASLHLARAVARRLERRIVSVFRRRHIHNRQILIYLNRLSDVLYLLAEQSALL